MYKSQDGRREGQRLERVTEGEGKNRRDRSLGLLVSSLSKVVISLQEVNKTTPYGYDMMQMKSQREETLIAS